MNETSRRKAGRRQAVQAGLLAAGLAASLGAPPARAQNCPEPKASDFKVTTLLSSGMTHPVHIAVAPDGRVFIAEMRTGDVKLYKPGSSTPTVAGRIQTRYDNEDGLLGITLDPDFARNGFLYAIYTAPDATNRAHVVSRFKVQGDALDIGSKVDVLRFNRVAGGRYHAGGGMAWDRHGNLIIGTGDDTNPHGAPNDGYGAVYYKDPDKDAQKSASNTNDLRGKVLRIKPLEQPVGGKHYSIPEGNLYPEGTANTRPEIFAMGCRNPYRVSAHPDKDWIFWGDVGPDANGNNASRGRMGHDEVNLAKAPGFFGWPYCNGNQFAYNKVDYSGASGVPGAPFDCAAPVNESPNNTGLRELPPSQAPLIWYAGNNRTDWTEMGQGGEAAMAGPVYKYDRANPSKTKFPPEYHGRLFLWDWSRQVYKIVSFEDDGKVKQMVNFPNAQASQFGSLVSAAYGADGSLYILRYSKSGYGDEGTSSALFRVDYTGTINEACEPPVSIAEAGPKARGNGSFLRSVAAGRAVFELPEEAAGIEVFDLKGKRVWREGRGGRTGLLRLEMPAHLASGVVRARIY